MDASSQTQPKKRGRKRIAEPLDNIKGNTSLDADAKRKLQNRAAQRAFRERKEKHLSDLEERVKTQEAQLDAFRETIRSLVAENNALRVGENPPRTSLPPSLEVDAPAQPASASASASPSHPPPIPSVLLPPPSSPEDVKPTFHVEPSPAPVEAAPSLHFTPNPTSPAVPAEQPFSATLAVPMIPSPVPDASAFPSFTPGDIDMAALDDLKFDFDAPFDFSDSIALPPLFSSLLDDPTAATSSSAGPLAPPASDGYDGDACPGEDDDDEEPPALPGGRIPCDKPECDFSSQSCMLPIPWRPPTVSDEKHLWLAQKCWAKLLSHPLFSQVDSDELCQELRDRTRCSTDGRLVCHKSDVCDIFRSIPLKAKLRAQALSMQ
ncbi:DNA-binding transcription factor yap1 [Rhodotorula kratochvilovae]